MTPKTILNIPHSSVYIPDHLRKKILLDDKSLEKEILTITDMYTSELYDVEDTYKVIAPVSRIIVDTERFVDDNLESMSKIGMGVIYTKTSKLEILRDTPSADERKELLEQFYYPHHKKLFELTKEVLEKFGKALIIDCHSFGSKQPPYEKISSNNKSLKRPQICIGTDSFHTPSKISEKIVSLFKNKGYEVDLNTPFSGSIVPLEYYSKDKSVKSVMIELRKDLYMNEETGEKTKDFDKLKKDINDVIIKMSEDFYSKNK